MLQTARPHHPEPVADEQVSDLLRAPSHQDGVHRTTSQGSLDEGFVVGIVEPTFASFVLASFVLEGFNLSTFVLEGLVLEGLVLEGFVLTTFIQLEGLVLEAFVLEVFNILEGFVLV
jgi:hypothetical protein